VRVLGGPGETPDIFFGKSPIFLEKDFFVWYNWKYEVAGFVVIFMNFEFSLPSLKFGLEGRWIE
jgi:hypothetical protein